DERPLVDVRALVELAQGPVERVERPPPGRVVRDRRAEVVEVDGPERDGEHDVEGQDEQHHEPDGARCDERWPVPSGVPDAAAFPGRGAPPPPLWRRRLSGPGGYLSLPP